MANYLMHNGIKKWLRGAAEVQTEHWNGEEGDLSDLELGRC